MTAGQLNYGVCTFVLWAIVFPLLLQLQAVNAELGLHVKLVEVKVQGGDKDPQLTRMLTKAKLKVRSCPTRLI